jgi:HEAT repeat protein
VQAPSLAGDVLTFYWESPGINAHELMRGTFHRTSLELRSEPVRAASGDEVAEAQRMLEGTARSMYRIAIDKLAACSDKRAAGVLARTVQSHRDAEARGHAAEVMARCHDKSSAAALIKALDSDKDSGVRWRAAATLGALGDPSAVPALTRASNDADPNVSYAAKTALGKLK